MKRIVSVTLLFLGLAAGAPAQGIISMDNVNSVNSISVGTQGNWYSGTFSVEVWLLNAGSVPPDLNAVAATNGLAAYSLLAQDGFHLQQAFVGQSANQGLIILGAARLPDAFPAATVVLALAAWNTDAASWTAMLAGADANTRAGVLTFMQPTGNPFESGMVPPSLNLDNAGRDLLMLPVPEPGAMPLAVLGAALLWSFRRRRQFTPDRI